MKAKVGISAELDKPLLRIQRCACAYCKAIRKQPAILNHDGNAATNVAIHENRVGGRSNCSPVSLGVSM